MSILKGRTASLILILLGVTSLPADAARKRDSEVDGGYVNTNPSAETGPKCSTTYDPKRNLFTKICDYPDGHREIEVTKNTDLVPLPRK